MKKYVVLLLLVLGGIVGINCNVSAVTYQTGVGVGFTFNPTLSINLSSADILIPNLAPGNSSDSNTITVTVNTNTAYGYTLNATVGEATNYNTRNLIRSDINDSFSSIAYGSSLASLTTDNTWGYSYKPSGQSSTWTTYSGLPLYNDTENVATLISTENAADSDSVEFKIAAKASTTQPAGDYKNVINFIAVTNPEPHLEPVPCESSRICYNVNSLDPTEGTMGKQIASANASVMLLASNFSRSGYGFAGWSDVHDYDTNPNAHFYGPQETITTPADMSAGLSLYAVWVKSAGYMQSSTSAVCNRLTTAPTDGTANLSSVSALTDQRDNNTYAIAKLADGNCWMIENLRLEAENTRTPEKQALAQGYGTSATYGNFSGLADAESTGFTDTYTANSLYYSGTQEGTASIDIGTSKYPAYRMPRYNNWNNQSTSASRPQNPTIDSATNSTTNAGMYSYGNYYTWHAAIADTTYYSSGDHNTTSICPTGWQLPLGNTSTGDIEQGAADATNKVGGFSYLDRKMGGTGAYQSTSLRWRTFPNNFLYSGGFYTSSANSRGAGGRYWSSTAYSNNNSYSLNLDPSNLSPGTTYYDKYDGFSIRCTASAGS